MQLKNSMLTKRAATNSAVVSQKQQLWLYSSERTRQSRVNRSDNQFLATQEQTDVSMLTTCSV